MTDDLPSAPSDTSDPGPELDEAHPAVYPTTAEEEGAALPTGVDAGSTRLLVRLLRTTPFLDLHRRYGSQPAWRGHLCFALDLVLRLVVFALLMGIVAGVAWKALAPLPPFWER